MHAAVYDYSANHMYVSFAGPATDDNGRVLPGSKSVFMRAFESRLTCNFFCFETDTTDPAYNRPWFGLDMGVLLNLPQN